MSVKAVLEDFGMPKSVRSAASGLAQVDLEAEKLEAFEQGYRAGWDDAIKVQSDDQARIASDFAQNLQDLSFTYHEAYSRVLNAMSPLLQDMVASLLPVMARETLTLHLMEHLEGIAQECGNLAVIIAVSPGSRDAVDALLTKDFGFPLEIQEDETLGEGQADIRFGETERQIDLTDVVVSIRQAIEAFAFDNHRKAANG